MGAIHRDEDAGNAIRHRAPAAPVDAEQEVRYWLTRSTRMEALLAALHARGDDATP